MTSRFRYVGAMLVVVAIAQPIVPSRATQAAAAMASTRDIHAGHVAEAARRSGIPEHWIWAVMQQESSGDVGAISHAGAMGLMQIMPGTWALLRVQLSLGNDPFDPRDNIVAGAAYLRDMYDRYGSAGMLAAYNAGPGRYEAYLRNGRPLPTETRAYLHRLLPLIGADPAIPLGPAMRPEVPSWMQASLFPKMADGSHSVVVPDPDGRSSQPSDLFIAPVERER